MLSENRIGVVEDMGACRSDLFNGKRVQVGELSFRRRSVEKIGLQVVDGDTCPNDFRAAAPVMNEIC